MSKFDDLRATTEKDDDTVVSIHVPRDDSKKILKKSPTFLSVLTSALKLEKVKPNIPKESAPYVVPVPKYSLITFCFIISIFVLLLVMRTFMDLKIMIPLTLLFLVLAVPSLIFVFFIEFNTRKTIVPFTVVIMTLLGLFAYAFVTTICDKFLITFIYESYIDTIGRPIAWTIILYIAVFICCNVLRVSKLPETMLISVSFTLGYAIAQAFLTGFESLFVNTTITINGTEGGLFNVGAILNDLEGLEQSLDQLNARWFETFVYKTMHLSSLSVIISCVVTYKERSKIERKPMIKSLYLFVLLDVLLYLISVVETNFLIFDSVLKTVAIVCSISLSIRIIDYALEKESRENVS